MVVGSQLYRLREVCNRGRNAYDINVLSGVQSGVQVWRFDVERHQTMSHVHAFVWVGLLLKRRRCEQVDVFAAGFALGRDVAILAL